ncbi:MAG: arginyltransferase [Gammaproteobacteria bacterium]|nr:MAG: arginyltransferase [Gammaproteobacteria bacterium]
MYQFGVSQEFPCSYLPEQQERLLIAVEPQLQTLDGYSWLMSQGFRRCGEQVYRPHCLHCHACQSVRVLVNDFSPSKSQKRLLKKNQRFTIKIKNEKKDYYYPLYEQYISEIHAGGAMFPPNQEQYQTFLTTELTKQYFIETWDQDKLISVAVTDILNNALSAVYTFYHPDYKKSALGLFSILTQIEISQQNQKQFLYLGYQIDACNKMNYKNRYFPYQILMQNEWNLALK